MSTSHDCPEGRCDSPSSTCYTHGCHCQGCRDERSARERQRQRRLLEEKYGARRPKWTDPAPVRAHVRSLMASDVGATDGASWKRIARAAGLSPSTVCHLLYGKRGEPIARMLTANADALLAVTPDDVRAPGQTVDADRTHRLVDYLLSNGWTKAAIGAWVTGNPDCRALQIGDDQVKAGTEDTVLDLVRRFNDGHVDANQRPDHNDLEEAAA